MDFSSRKFYHLQIIYNCNDQKLLDITSIFMSVFSSSGSSQIYTNKHMPMYIYICQQGGVFKVVRISGNKKAESLGNPYQEACYLMWFYLWSDCWFEIRSWESEWLTIKYCVGALETNKQKNWNVLRAQRKKKLESRACQVKRIK